MPLTGLPDAVDAPDTVVMIMFPPLHGFAVTDVFRVYYATVSGTGPFEAIRLRRGFCRRIRRDDGFMSQYVRLVVASAPPGRAFAGRAAYAHDSGI